MSKYILSKSSKEIKNLDNNKYLFSNYKLSGRVLLYENLGKSKSVTISEKHKSNITPRISSATFKVHEGRGLIVAEIEIKEVYDDLKVQEFNCMISYGDTYFALTSDRKELVDMSNARYYKNQKYAYEIKNLTTLPKPRRLDVFIVESKWDKFKEYMHKNIRRDYSDYSDNDYLIEYNDRKSHNSLLLDVYCQKVNGIVRVIDSEEG